MNRALRLGFLFLGITASSKAQEPQLSISDIVVPEGNSGQTFAVFTVTLAGPHLDTVNVSWQTRDLTALGDIDYVSAWGTLSFEPSDGDEQTREISVRVLGDTDIGVEGSETFFVDLTKPPNATLLKGTGHGVIEDDDFHSTRARCDFNGDGRSEIMVRRVTKCLTSDPPCNHYLGHEPWGATATILEEEPSAPPIALTDPDTWKAVAMGDFDHDGICDVFWDDDHGANAVTSTPLSGVIPAQPRAADVVVADAVAGTSKWQLVGSGDFTADGRDDILWWNPGKGRLRLWVADEEGHFPLSLRQTLTGWPDTQWEPLATADLDGGPIPHVIWRNKVTGKLYHWLGLSPTTSGYLTPDSTAAMNWRIVAAGDFDGDGKADLLWQNQEDQSRKVVIWFMNGPVRRTGSLTTPDRFGPVLDPTVEWNIVGPR